tara:strand:+ start:634 stop:795 length:162 start_codon:yes stop_codon:yes gene_type:complete
MISEKRPRHYAAEIMALKTRQERRDALDKVPEKYKDWVADLVKSAYSLRRKTP